MTRFLEKYLRPFAGDSTRALLRRLQTEASVRSHRMLRACAGIHRREPLGVTWTRYSVPEHQTFFGYHDRTPFSGDGRKLLACVAKIALTSPDGHDELELGYFDHDRSNIFVPIGSTTIWCWQQGCMYQWLARDRDDMVVYNVRNDRGFGAEVHDILSGRTVQRYGKPLYCVNAAGMIGLSVNFSRLQDVRPGYGYPGVADRWQAQAAPVEDGLWRIDLADGRSDLLWPLHSLAGIDPRPTMSGAIHYLNHVVFNPTGTRCAFLHLWVQGKRRFSRMFTCNPDGGELYLLANLVSHYAWKSTDQIVLYSADTETGRGFYLHRDRTQERSTVLGTALVDDGHPSFSPDGALLLLDSYPDRFGEQQLFIVAPNGVRTDLARLNSQRVRGPEFRCDLHPRWDRLGKRICVDSTWHGNREIYVASLNGC